MFFSEKPSGCDIEQAGVVAVVDGQGSGVKLRLLWIIIFSMCVSCNIAMFLWIRSIEHRMNALNSQKVLEMQSVSDFPSKCDDENDNDEDYPANVNIVVRAVADDNRQDKDKDIGKSKGKNNGKRKDKGKKRRNGKRHGKGKRGCACSDLLKKLKSKRDVSGSTAHMLTYMKGIKKTAFQQDPYNVDGQFLWQEPGPNENLGVYFQYNKDLVNGVELVKAIKIGISGTYEFKAQVTLGGVLANVDIRDCGVELVKTRGGSDTVLAGSALTQASSSTYGQSSPEPPVDTVKVGGIFYLRSGDEVFVRKTCNHVKFLKHEGLSSFSAVLWNRS